MNETASNITAFAFFRSVLASKEPNNGATLQKVFRLITSNEKLALLTQDVRTAARNYHDAAERFGKDSEEGKAAKALHGKAKQKLPGVCVGGTFSERNAASCTKPSGFICIDLDHVTECGTDPNELKARLSQDPELCTLLAFTSPSGDVVNVQQVLRCCRTANK